jgi:hypothetical protein
LAPLATPERSPVTSDSTMLVSCELAKPRPRPKTASAGPTCQNVMPGSIAQIAIAIATVSISRPAVMIVPMLT